MFIMADAPVNFYDRPPIYIITMDRRRRRFPMIHDNVDRRVYYIIMCAGRSVVYAETTVSGARNIRVYTLVRSCAVPSVRVIIIRIMFVYLSVVRPLIPRTRILFPFEHSESSPVYVFRSESKSYGIAASVGGWYHWLARIRRRVYRCATLEFRMPRVYTRNTKTFYRSYTLSKRIPRNDVNHTVKINFCVRISTVLEVNKTIKTLFKTQIFD